MPPFLLFGLQETPIHIIKCSFTCPKSFGEVFFVDVHVLVNRNNRIINLKKYKSKICKFIKYHLI